MRVLQFATRVCWPLDTGAKLRNYHLARVLSAQVQVTLLAFADNEPSFGNLGEYYEQLITVRRSPGYTPGKVLRGALGRIPVTVLNYTTDAMSETLKRLLTEHSFDIVQLEGTHLMAYLPVIRATSPRTVAICDWHNIESEVMKRYAERESNILRKRYAQRTAKQLGRLEQRASGEFDAHLVVSERDRAQLRQLDRDTRVFVIENGVDTSHYSDERIDHAHGEWRPQTDRDPTKHRIVFVGSMDYHANIDAVVNFAREVWPDLHRRKPELSYTIVGRDPAAAVRELSSLQGVEVTGTVDDVRPYYREAIAAIVPLRIGGGSRLKILEAMAAGVPVISTSLGAEGLAAQNGENIVIADTKEEILEAIVSIVDDPTRQNELRTAGRTLAASRYDWLTLGESLVKVYQELLSNRSPA